MKGRNEAVNWKLVLIPVAALSVAFAAGTKFFFGGGEQPSSSPAGIDFGSDRAEEPETLAARKISVSPGSQASSLDMFQEVNKDYYDESAAKPRAGDGRLASASPAAASASGGSVDPYEHYAKAQQGDLEAPAVPELPKGPAPWMKGAPGTGTPGDPALSLKTSVASSAPESRKALSSSRNFGRSGFSSGGGQAMGRDRLGAGGNAEFSQGSNSRGSANTVSNSNFTSAAGMTGAGEGGGMSYGGGSSSSGGSSSAASDSGSASGSELTTHQQEKPFPFLAVWPNQIHFGKIYRYETAYRMVSVTNTGNADLRIKKVDNLDPDAPFSLTSNSCNGKNLKPGESCGFRVKFNPLGIKSEYISGFDVETDDSDNNSYYNGLVEVRGGSAYNYWAYLLRYYNYSGMLGKAVFGQISSGASFSQNIYVINTTGHIWKDIQLVKSGLPSAYSVTSENCSGKTLGSWGSCVVTVKFSPKDSNVRHLNSNYGKYNITNINTKAKGVSSNPRYPDVIESLNFSVPKGIIDLTAKRTPFFHRMTVSRLSVHGEACAKFPVKGALRSGNFWYFR